MNSKIPQIFYKCQHSTVKRKRTSRAKWGKCSWCHWNPFKGGNWVLKIQLIETICTHAGTHARPTELKWSNAHACLTLQGTAQRYSVWLSYRADTSYPCLSDWLRTNNFILLWKVKGGLPSSGLNKCSFYFKEYVGEKNTENWIYGTIKNLTEILKILTRVIIK